MLYSLLHDLSQNWEILLTLPLRFFFWILNPVFRVMVIFFSDYFFGLSAEEWQVSVATNISHTEYFPFISLLLFWIVSETYNFFDLKFITAYVYQSLTAFPIRFLLQSFWKSLSCLFSNCRSLGFFFALFFLILVLPLQIAPSSVLSQEKLFLLTRDIGICLQVWEFLLEN